MMVLQFNVSGTVKVNCDRCFGEFDLPISGDYRLVVKVGGPGIHPSVVELLRDLINNDVYPQIFEHGGVGASGDLVQLAHLALNLIGEGVE